MKKITAVALTLAIVLGSAISAFADVLSGLDLAIVQTPTAVFTAPDLNSPVLSKAMGGKKLILVSRSFTKGWANVIDYSTGHQGWVLSQRVKMKYSSHKDQSVNLTAQQGGDSTVNSTVTITNRMGNLLFLHIEGLPEVLILPGVDKSVEVPSGIRAFNVAGPLVIPRFGSKAFINGERYTWKWWTANGHQPDTVASKSDIAQFNSLQNEIKTLETELKSTRVALDTLNANLEKEKADLALERSNVEAKRVGLDSTSQAEIDAFNQMVDDANTHKTTLLAELAAYDKSVEDYNQKAKALRAKYAQIDNLADSVNGHARSR